MSGDGPFVWLSEKGPPASFHRLPKGGMCLSAFVFLRRGSDILLGQYADDPRWANLTGLDEDRRRIHGRGWTIPASHLKYGEDPRQAARRIVDDVLQMPGLVLSEPRVETEAAVPVRFPDMGLHYDVWFFFEAAAPAGEPARPPWFRSLAYRHPRALPPGEGWARSHEDIAARWAGPPGGPFAASRNAAQKP